MKTTKKNVKILCCDNADENKTLRENSVRHFKEIKFEFPSPGTPQQNGVVERGFNTPYSRMSAMMKHTRLH